MIVPDHLVAARARSTSSPPSSSCAPRGSPSCACRSSSGRSSSPSFLLLLAFPPLEAAAIHAADGPAGRHRASSCRPASWSAARSLAYTGGGNPLLWQHLFWFLAHPEVYVLILPAMGIVAEIIANNTRKPLWGYKIDGVLALVPRLHVVHRLGAPHVHDRHGHDDGGVLPDDHDDHLDPVGGDPDLRCSSRCGADRSASTRRCSSRSPSCRCSASAA